MSTRSTNEFVPPKQWATTKVMMGDTFCAIVSGDVHEHHRCIRSYLKCGWAVVFNVRFPRIVAGSDCSWTSLLRLKPRAVSTVPLGCRLSPREAQVFDLARQALTAREMADRLELSQRTIYVFRARLRRKLGVPRSADLTHFVQQSTHKAA